MARCKHSWDLLDKTILPSGWEQLGNGQRSIDSAASWVFEKKVVYIFKCAHCGDIRKEVESCPTP